MIRIALLVLIFFEARATFAQNVAVREEQRYILTHLLVPAGPIPTAFDPNGVYPYVSYVETSNRPVPKKYRLVVLENKNLVATICPDLGGKVMSIVHKPSGKEVLYVPDVIRYTRILPRFYFVAGGIEVSFPISHSPSQNEPVLYKIDKTSDRIYVSCGERELRFGMHWTVEWSLGNNDDFLTERVIYKNPGSKPYPWMSWSNAAVPTSPATEYSFPAGKVLSHSSVIDSIDWKTQGPKHESDIKEMTGYFWKTRDANAFGAYDPNFGTGLYHIADEKVSPGMKLWSYGNAADSAWATLSTARMQPYAEIQGGPIGDQSTKLELQPNQERSHVEFWIPSDRRLNIYDLKVPSIKLRAESSIPLFSVANKDVVDVWTGWMMRVRDKVRVDAPPIEEMHWAPSLFENLDDAFEKSIKTSDSTNADLWRFYYGAWLAGRGEKDKAIAILSSSNVGVAKALLARLLKLKGDINGALTAIGSIKEPWLRIHPQVVIDHDKLLRLKGKETLKQREELLASVSALKDEWLIEREVQLLIDKGMFKEAKKLLLSTPFQKVHQVYVRTNLWNQICGALKEPCLPVPTQLGEDRLANFGAYREFD